MSTSLATNINDVKNNQFIDSSLQNLSEEINAIQASIAQKLDAESGNPDEAQVFSAQAAKKIAEQLDQVAGALSMLHVEEASRLVEHLKIAILKVGNSDQALALNQRQAIFESSFLLTRYISHIRTLRNEDSEELPLILSPCFYTLASAGMAPFVDESELTGFTVSLKGGDACKSDELSADKLQTCRSLRKMYQVALIGLLRGSSAEEQFKLIDRVAGRIADIASDEFSTKLWQSLGLLVGQYRQENLELTPQRRHFFARFDKILRQLSSGQSIAYAEQQQTITELCFLLLLSGRSQELQRNMDSHVQFEQIAWNDQQILNQRKSVGKWLEGFNSGHWHCDQ